MIRQLSTLSILALFAGCTSVAEKTDGPAYDGSQSAELLSPDLYSTTSSREPTVRYGRYALVNTAPELEQRDLMAQIIDVSIPANMHPSVQDAMHYVVSRSGYTLCPPSTEHVNILFTRPLPAAQYKLGPMSLRNTLQVLAGPAWQVKVNEVTRGVCFALRPGYKPPDVPKPALLAPTSVPSSTGALPSAKTSSAVTVVTAPAAAAPFTKDLAPATDPNLATGVKSNLQPKATISTPAKEGSPTQQNPAPAAAVAAKTAAPTPVPRAATVSNTGRTPPEPGPLPAPALQENWDAPVGSTLRQTVEGWAKKANWQLIWAPADLDYPIEAALQFRGSFVEAITQIFPLYDSARRPFTVNGNVAQRILHISEREKK
ncbi:type IV pili sensor histidine kinase and response regulator [Pseudomonas asturiensis]|uniref:Type IV pili sensor histidine kinase and response regulator n=1 Tax=Pseudomonas asturiensis TaxID=1190415 RepID=A0A1M7P7K3_9PSED|nr:TcpQ domain-containing protein [Pseudomonas asturiensis]SHN12595.1 type IV pili sensor histidine kinase and response regulator [Pseudomonas asturiensis]